jgi:hypothetical protein
MGVLVLALFARQTVAIAWGTDAAAAHARMTATPAAHQHAMPPSPAPAAPRHHSGCDGTSPSDCCAVGSSCVFALVVPPVKWADATRRAPAVTRPSSADPLWRDIAPADPPPRA